MALTTAAAARKMIAGGQGPALASVTEVLEAMLGTAIPNPTAVHHTSWLTDPHVRGSYSAAALGQHGDDGEALAAPVDGRVPFAGEATSEDRCGYADGAFTTGVREAKRLLGSAAVKITPSGACSTTCESWPSTPRDDAVAIVEPRSLVCVSEDRSP